MTKVKLNNGNETKSEISSWDIFKSDITLHWPQNAFIMCIFQLHCKSEVKKQVKSKKKIKQSMYKSDRIFPYLQSSTPFELLLKFIP